MNQADRRATLVSIYNAAVAAAQPATCLPPHFPDAPESGHLLVLATGKASSAMAEAAERHYASTITKKRFHGFATIRRGYGMPLSEFEFIEASHPVPDRKSAEAATRALALASQAAKDDLVLVLMSGGASALWSAPVAGVTLEDKQELTRTLLKAGAPISAINCVRKHLSRIKGGHLARAAYPADLVTLAISDVPGDAPDIIGSGPTVPDSTTLSDAEAVLARYRIAPALAIAAALKNPANETPKPDDPAFSNTIFKLAATPKDALQAAADKAATFGYKPILLGDALEGEARNVAQAHAAIALETRERGERAAILSGGELTVTIKGGGRGGPNQEYALALAIALNGAPDIYALAADTDGSDGGTGKADDPAGAMIVPDTLQRASYFGQTPADFLLKNDSTGFFEMLDDLVISGPTFTNINDLRVILVEP